MQWRSGRARCSAAKQSAVEFKLLMSHRANLHGGESPRFIPPAGVVAVRSCPNESHQTGGDPTMESDRLSTAVGVSRNRSGTVANAQKIFANEALYQLSYTPAVARAHDSPGNEHFKAFHGQWSQGPSAEGTQLHSCTTNADWGVVPNDRGQAALPLSHPSPLTNAKSVCVAGRVSRFDSCPDDRKDALL
jgi:hypothetical protein